MKYVFALALPLFCFGQEAPATPPTPPSATALKSDKSVITIDVKSRAADFIQAFELLHRDKPTAKIMVRTSGELITSVVDMSLSKQGSLFFVKVLSNQGMKYQIVPVEEVLEVGYSP